MLSKFMEIPNNLIKKWQLMLIDNYINGVVIGNSFRKVYASIISTKIRCFQYRQ